MALSIPKFGKKKKAAAAEESEEVVETTPKTKDKRKRKANELLSSVVKESEPGSAMDLLARNERFVLPREAGWLVLLLDVESDSFGGLSAKHRGNPDKGSIIELITGDQIEVVVTAEMLATDILGIVPTEQTLTRMEEYRLLTGAEYLWGVITPEGEGLEVNPVAEASFEHAVEISSGRTSVAALLPEVWAWAKGESAARPTSSGSDAGLEILDGSEPTAAVPAVPAPTVEEHDDDEPMLGGSGSSAEPATVTVPEPALAPAPTPAPAAAEVLDPEDEGAVDYSAMDASEGGWDEGEEGEPQSFFDPEDEDGEQDQAQDEAYAEYAQHNAGREVAESEVRSSIVRRLSPEDLDVQIDLEEFDAAFSTDAPAVGIEVAGADAWLADQVGDHVRQANAQIYKMHTDNVALLRRQFVALMSEHSEKVVSDLSTEREGSHYQSLLAAADTDFTTEMNAGEAETAAAQRQITERFDAEAEEAARAAYEQAKAKFNIQNRPMRERLIAEAGHLVSNRAEERLAHRRQVVLEMRRNDARLAMEVGATRAMQLLSELQDQQHQAEMDLLAGWNERILAFIDENRKDDVARTQTLSEQIARDTQVADLTAAFAAEREQLAAEQARRIKDLEAQMLAHRERAMVQVREIEAESSRQLDAERVNSASAQQVIITLQEQLKELGASYEEKYADQIRTLKEDRDSFSMELERADAVQARSNKVLVLLVVVMAIAALAVGMILGWAMALPTTAGMVLLTSEHPLTGMLGAIAGS